MSQDCHLKTINMKNHLPLSIFFLFTFYNNASASDGCTDNFASYSNGTSIALEEIKYNFPNPGQSTWFYAVNNKNGSKGVSHTSFKVSTCITSNEFIEGGTYINRTKSGMTKSSDSILGYDGSYKNGDLYAIKYEKEIVSGQVTKLYFILNNNFKTSLSSIFIKPGSTFQSDFICLPSTTCAALPVKLLSFAAKEAFNGTIELNWSTATEKNNHGFYVQRSLNGADFEDVAFVESGHNSNSIRNYSYTDIGVNKAYYRLRIVDFDGFTEYTHVVFINLTENSEVSLFPTIVQHQLTIYVKSTVITHIKITDLSGKDVTQAVQISPMDRSITIDQILLSKGWYVVEINRLFRVRFYKE